MTQGILLDKRGIENKMVSFCKDCYSYIEKGKTPPLSLANHLLLGDIPPELQGLTPVEESVIARCRAKACIIQLKGDNDVILPNMQRGMRGHIIIYPQKPENILNVLPHSVKNICAPICIVFIGSQRPMQTWLRSHAKPLIVRRERIRKALIWLKAHNILYCDIKIDENTLTTFPENDILSVHIEIIDREDSGEGLSSWYNEPQFNQNPSTNSINDTIFNSIVVTDLNNDATVNQMRAAAINQMKAKGGGFLQIPHADKPANEFYNSDLLPLTYPTLFPYGVGGFEDLQL